jgi:hypothetical protein
MTNIKHQIGDVVDYRYVHPITYERVLGSGTIVGDSVIIGTDYGWSIRRDDGQVVEVRDFNVWGK